MIYVGRVYDAPVKKQGRRYLVERLWPRGNRKVDLPLEAWLKEVAPSTELRRWYQHDPAKWAEFQRRYRTELGQNEEAWRPLLQAARRASIVLLYSAHDTEHNSALVLKALLDQQLTKAGSKPG